MKKFNTMIGALTVLFMTACTGPEGPPGFDGTDGIQGQVIEVDLVNFVYDGNTNLYSALITLADESNFRVFESDAILVYRFDGTIALDGGSTADAWTQLPQNFFLPEGTLQYVFAHTFVDVELFIDGNFDLSTIDTSFTDSQSFRIVIVPSMFASTSKMDTSRITDVMATLGIGEDQVRKIGMD